MLGGVLARKAIRRPRLANKAINTNKASAPIQAGLFRDGSENGNLVGAIGTRGGLPIPGPRPSSPLLAMAIKD